MNIEPTTITQKGQVTIPVEIRRLLRLKSGDLIKFMHNSKNEVKIKPVKRSSIMSLYGSLKPKIKPKLSGQKLIKWEEQAWPEAAVERDLRTMRRS